jgi:hypothetical protein
LIAAAAQPDTSTGARHCWARMKKTPSDAEIHFAGRQKGKEYALSPRRFCVPSIECELDPARLTPKNIGGTWFAFGTWR